MPIKIFDPVQSGQVTVDGRVMENGEKRLRMRLPEGVYNYTYDGRGWQNAHHHKGVCETYIVERGWIGVIELRDGRRHSFIKRAGEVFTAEPGIDHNVYVPRDAVIHTVQHGTPVGNPLKEGNDWYPSPDDFDSWSKSITEQEILASDREE